MTYEFMTHPESQRGVTAERKERLVNIIITGARNYKTLKEFL